MTARQMIERRLGKSLGPLATMPPDHRRALKLLALKLLRIKSGFRITPDREETVERVHCGWTDR